MTIFLLVMLIGCCAALGWLTREHLALQDRVRELSAEVHRLKRPTAHAKRSEDTNRRLQELFSQRTWAPPAPQVSARPSAAHTAIPSDEPTATDRGIPSSAAGKGDTLPTSNGAK